MNQPRQAPRFLGFATALASLALAVSAYAQAPGSYPGPQGPGAAPVTPPVATPTSTPPSDPAGCTPACRPGFYCKAARAGKPATCETLCNPPCGPGEVCTSERLCVLPAPAFPYQPPPGLPPQAAPVYAAEMDREVIWEARAREREERLQARLIPRVTAAAGFVLGSLNRARTASTPAGSVEGDVIGLLVTGGYRKHFNEIVGVDLKVGGLIGQAALRDADRSQGSSAPTLDDTRALELLAEGGPVFTPFWRVYFGPTVGVHYRDVGTATLETGTLAVETHRGFATSIGMQAGVTWMRREQLDVRMQLAADSHREFRFVMAGGFNFLLGGG